MRQCRERIGASGVTPGAGAGDRRPDRKTGPGPSNHAGFAVKCRQNLRQVSPELPSNVAGFAVKCRQILQSGDRAPMELPVTGQMATILERRWSEQGQSGTGWVFPSRRSATGHLVSVSNHYAAIGRAGGSKFRYRSLRQCFVAVAEWDLSIPHALTRRLIDPVPPEDEDRGYAPDWTVDRLREASQRIADRIESLADTACDGAIQPIAPIVPDRAVTSSVPGQRDGETCPASLILQEKPEVTDRLAVGPIPP